MSTTPDAGSGITSASGQAALRVDADEDGPRYRSLLASMDEGYCLIDLLPAASDAVEDFRFVEANAAFGRHTGLCDVVGKRMSEVMQPLPQVWLELYGQVAITGVAQRKLHHLPNTQRWFDVSVTRVGAAGSRRLALLATEVTERVLTEIQLRDANHALAETDRRKTAFLATLAHELRNPLAPLRNGLSVLRQSQDPGTQARMLELMERQLGQLSRLVEDLLDVARLNTGKVTLRPTRVDLRELATHAVEACQALATAAGHQLLLQLDPQPLWASVDPARMAQVLHNLLNNAIKYTLHPGHIELQVRRAGDQAALSVSDDGEGIAPEALPRVFEMFAQLDKARDQARGGLGIGLALVRALVQLHGGQVDARSEGPGRGATFTVHLPLEPAIAAAAAPLPPAPAEAGPPAVASQGLQVLVVDDNADAAESLALILQMDGHVAQVATTSAQALEMAARFHPRVIFLDIGMPGMDGYEIARRLRAQPGETPVLVALTGWSTDEDTARARQACFDHRLTKPADPAQVARLLRAIAEPA